MNAVPWLASGLAIAFLAAGGANLAGFGTIKVDFARWGYPPGFHRMAGAVEIVGAAALLHPASRMIGLVLLGLTMTAALITLVRYREGLKHIASAGALGLALVALFAIGP